MSIQEKVKMMIIENPDFAMWYMLCSTVAIIVMVAIKKKRKNKYMKWKEDQINFFGIFKRVYKPNEDVVFEQLFEENQRFETEVKKLKELLKERNFSVFSSLLIMMFLGYKVGQTKAPGLKKNEDKKQED